MSIECSAQPRMATALTTAFPLAALPLKKVVELLSKGEKNKDKDVLFFV